MRRARYIRQLPRSTEKKERPRNTKNKTKKIKNDVNYRLVQA